MSANKDKKRTRVTIYQSSKVGGEYTKAHASQASITKLLLMLLLLLMMLWRWGQPRAVSRHR